MAIRQYRNEGRFSCVALVTEYVFGPGQLAKLFGLDVPVSLNAANAAGGYNQLTFSLFGTGAGTWSVDVSLTKDTPTNWVRIATALPNQTAIVSLGPLHPGVFVPGASYALLACTVEAVRIVLSAPNADGRIDVVVQGFNQ